MKSRILLTGDPRLEVCKFLEYMRTNIDYKSLENLPIHETRWKDIEVSLHTFFFRNPIFISISEQHTTVISHYNGTCSVNRTDRS